MSNKKYSADFFSDLDSLFEKEEEKLKKKRANSQPKASYERNYLVNGEPGEAVAAPAVSTTKNVSSKTAQKTIGYANKQNYGNTISTAGYRPTNAEPGVSSTTISSKATYKTGNTSENNYGNTIASVGYRPNNDEPGSGASAPGLTAGKEYHNASSVTAYKTVGNTNKSKAGNSIMSVGYQPEYLEPNAAAANVVSNGKKNTSSTAFATVGFQNPQAGNNHDVNEKTGKSEISYGYTNPVVQRKVEFNVPQKKEKNFDGSNPSSYGYTNPAINKKIALGATNVSVPGHGKGAKSLKSDASTSSKSNDSNSTSASYSNSNTQTAQVAEQMPMQVSVGQNQDSRPDEDSTVSDMSMFTKSTKTIKKTTEITSDGREVITTVVDHRRRTGEHIITTEVENRSRRQVDNRGRSDDGSVLSRENSVNTRASSVNTRASSANSPVSRTNTRANSTRSTSTRGYHDPNPSNETVGCCVIS
mmetsp:Transcript_22803/g.29216  ORF Transcript_22803/g.29216 Transcript_22803/m.29216 type:complete len:473 (+) Transcript_22803:139-1557(+)